MYLTPEKQTKILKKGYDINVWISDRSGRKTSSTQITLIDQALKGDPFILLRNKKDEEITERWLSEYVVDYYKGYTFFTEKVNTNITSIKVTTPENETYIVCYGLYVSLAQKYKSNYYDGFERVKYIVWEECVPNTPLVQNIKYIRSRCMSEIYNVLSISSTIARDHKVQLIWLGNDISDNILNPVTIGFNLLERLTANMVITDHVELNDRQYSYYFEYFDFEGAVNHWLYSKNLQISREITPDEHLVRYDIRIKSEFNDYYIYNCGSYLHISDINYDVAKKMKKGIYSDLDFFRIYRAEHLLDEYPLRMALTMLSMFYGVPSSLISRYYGDGWYKISSPEIQPDQDDDQMVEIDLEKIIHMSLSDIIQLENYNSIREINELRKLNTMTYSNIKIMMLMEELGNILLFT